MSDFLKTAAQSYAMNCFGAATYYPLLGIAGQNPSGTSTGNNQTRTTNINSAFFGQDANRQKIAYLRSINIVVAVAGGTIDIRNHDGVLSLMGVLDAALTRDIVFPGGYPVRGGFSVVVAGVVQVVVNWTLAS